MSNGHPDINVCYTRPSRVDVQVRPVSLGGNMVSLVHMVSLEDKAPGCTRKSGSGPVKGVLKYAGKVETPAV